MVELRGVEPRDLPCEGRAWTRQTAPYCYQVKKEFSVVKVAKGIYLMRFATRYSMAMHFLRYQERYESPSPRFRGKSFRLLDFMDWYQAKYDKGCFTYPEDWSGFNVPSHVFLEQFEEGVPDRNRYDDAMQAAVEKMRQEARDRFYVIGALHAMGPTFRHEVAHGLFYTDPSYRRDALALVRGLPKAPRAVLEKYLKSVGYSGTTLLDEVHAYVSTGLPSQLKKGAAKRLEAASAPLKERLAAAMKAAGVGTRGGN